MYSDDFKKGYGSIQKTQESEFSRETLTLAEYLNGREQLRGEKRFLFEPL